MEGAKAIFISVPKYIDSFNRSPAVTVNGKCSVPIKVNATNMNSDSIIRCNLPIVSSYNKVKIEPLSEVNPDRNASCSGNNRKRKLDFLSFEEKILRKKLKNRVAAQTSRDKKKAKMVELETEVEELKEKNSSLITECLDLKTKNEELRLENERLRNELAMNSSRQTRDVGCSPVFFGPAESVNPRQKGLLLQPAQSLVVQMLFWRILMLCLLGPNCLEILKEKNISVNWKSLQKTCLGRLQHALTDSPDFQVRLMKTALIKIREIEEESKWKHQQQRVWSPGKISAAA